MYINFVLRLRNTLIPKTVVNSSVHAIVTRKSLLGFHKELKHTQFDSSCTKTELLLFTSELHATNMANILERSHKNKVRFTREITYEDHTVAKITNSLNFEIVNGDYADSMKPINTEVIPYNYLEKLCILHYFDMLIVNDMNIMQYNRNNNRIDYEIYLDCYQYKTFELPNRSIQEKLFRDMLYKD